MSKMQELYEKVSKDAALQNKFSAVMNDAEKTGADATKEKLAALAKDNGYDITIDEMKEYFKELAESKEGVLTDAELDMVAGGKVGYSEVKRLGHDALDAYVRFPNRMMEEFYDLFNQ
jgi:hypothetical protein